MKQARTMLNTTEFSNIEEKVQNARQQLCELQEQMRDFHHPPDLFCKEKDLKLNLEKSCMVKETINLQV